MANNLTDEECKWILKRYWKTENSERVREQWRETFASPPPTRLAIYRIHEKFERTGSIHNSPQSGRSVTVTTPENAMQVALAFTQNPQKSKNRASSELGIERRSLGRLMHRVGLKMYVPQLIHGLLEDDSDRRLQFCEATLNEEREGDSILRKIVWSDEANFKLSGAVNRHNCVYYATENLKVTIEQQLNQPGVTVWAGLSCKGVVGPIILHMTVDQHVYLNMLTDTIITQVREQQQQNDFYFQQDGAPPHFALTVRALLDKEFPNRWIGRRGTVDWPPRSPDLTPMDFFFWGCVKDRVFARKPRSVDAMIQFIREACQEIDADKDLCARVCMGVHTRLVECVNAGGKQFEHLRD